MVRRYLAATLLAAALAPAAFAADPPTGAEANRTVAYYYSDAQQPVLMDFRVCSEVQEQGDGKHDCKSTVDKTALVEGEEVVLWMKFLVPREASPTILMQVDQDGITRDTFERTLGGAIRYRTWNRVQLSRDGTWKVRVFHETEDEVRELYSGSLEVAPATSEEDATGEDDAADDMNEGDG